MTCYHKTDFQNFMLTLSLLIWWQKSFFIVYYMRNCIISLLCLYPPKFDIEYRSMQCIRCLLFWLSCAFQMHFQQFIETWTTMEQCSKSLSCMEHILNLNVISYSICTCEQINLHLLHMQKEVSNHWSIKVNIQFLNNKSMEYCLQLICFYVWNDEYVCFFFFHWLLCK